MYALISGDTVSQYPYSIQQLRHDNPSTSFPRNPDNALLAEWSVYPVNSTTPPAFNADTQKVTEGAPQYVDGAWVQSWTVVDLTPKEISNRLASWRSSAAVPRLAARLALIEQGLWDSLPPLIDAVPDATQKAQTLAFFEDAQSWRRDHPTVQSLGTGLGLDAAGLDALFVRAQEIESTL